MGSTSFFSLPLRIASGMAILCSGFALCAFAHESCRMDTFKGAYGFSVTGFVLPQFVPGSFGFTGEGTAVPIQGVQLITSDGQGNLTDKESISLGGQLIGVTDPEQNPFSIHYGTYTVNPDCTGTAFITNAKIVCPANPNNCPNVNFVHLAFVISKEGTKIRMVGVPPYDSNGILRVVTSIGEKLGRDEGDRDWRGDRDGR